MTLNFLATIKPEMITRFVHTESSYCWKVELFVVRIG